MGHTMIAPDSGATRPDGELPSQMPAESIAGGNDMDELPQEFHERLARLLGAFPNSTLASVRRATQFGSWAVEVRFGDRRETFVITYAPDQVVV